MIGIRIRMLQFNGDEAGAQDYAANGFNSPGTAGVRRTRPWSFYEWAASWIMAKIRKDDDFFPKAEYLLCLPLV
jgi:hypothetical protein